MLVQTRFAFGELDDPAAARLIARAFEPPAIPLATIDPASVVTLDMDAIATRGRRDYALLTGALGDELDAMGAPVTHSAADAIRHHVWLQGAFGADWLDLDTSLRDGSALASAQSTAPDLLEDGLRHTVTLTLEAATLVGDTRQVTTLMERELDAVAAQYSDIYLYFQPDVSGIGGSIVTVLTGDEKYVPVLLIDGEGEAGTPFSAGGRGTDILGDPTEAPELVGMRLVVTRQGPGYGPERAVSTLLDRVPPRLAPDDPLTAEDLAPMPESQGVPRLLGMIHHVILSTGAADLRSHAIELATAANFVAGPLSDPERANDYALQDLLWPVAVGDENIVVASEQLIVPGLAARPDIRAYVDRPRVYLSTIGPDPVVEGGVSASIDLTLDGVAIVGAGDVTAAEIARTQLWYGALQTALETEFMLKRARAIDPAARRLAAVSFEMDEPLTVVGPDAAARLDAGAARSLRGALEAGRVAVIPGDPAAASAFWSVDPASGATESILDGGLRGAFSGGGNYVNGSTGGPRHVVGPKGGDVGVIKDGKFYPTRNPPPESCGAGDSTGYVTILRCVSIPASWSVGVFVGATVVAIIAWAIVLMQLT
jgi:hypothetical protein